jgi:hypothetical protein
MHILTSIHVGDSDNTIEKVYVKNPIEEQEENNA